MRGSLSLFLQQEPLTGRHQIELIDYITINTEYFVNDRSACERLTSTKPFRLGQWVVS